MKKKTVMKIILIVVLCLAAVAAGVFCGLNWCGMLGGSHPLKTPEEGQIRVACVGDSITYGYGIPGRAKYSYPAVLQELLGDGYCVNNYGYSGRTASDSGDRPYRAENLCQKALDFRPDIVIVMLGSNDSKPYNWDPAAVRAGLGALLDDFAALESAPQIYMIAPPPVFPVHGKVLYDIDGDVIDNGVVPLTLGVAAGRGLPLIDMHTVFEGRADLFSDGCHPNKDGAKLFAETVYASVFRR